MKPGTIAVALAPSSGLLVTGALAQHEEHHSGPAAAPADTNKMPGKMPQMMTAQKEIRTLANRLLNTFSAIENEKDPALLQSKLAEHGALLKELQSELLGQSQMMEKMHGQMMMGGEQKKP